MTLLYSFSKGSTGVHTLAVCPFYISTGMFEGAKGLLINALMPILKPDYVVGRIIDSVIHYDELLCIPNMVLLPLFFKSFLPVWLYDWTNNLLGINKSMDDFVGRKKKV